jgi:hypothetical protein
VGGFCAFRRRAYVASLSLLRWAAWRKAWRAGDADAWNVLQKGGSDRGFLNRVHRFNSRRGHSACRPAISPQEQISSGASGSERLADGNEHRRGHLGTVLHPCPRLRIDATSGKLMPDAMPGAKSSGRWTRAP